MATSLDPPLIGKIVQWDHQKGYGFLQADNDRVFWLIVLVYQFAAYDSLQNWLLSRAAWDHLNSHAPQQFAPARHPLK
jgi:hypothetical protein